MLTFAADGADTAEEVARIFRQQRGTDRIGVLILGEQLRHLQADPNLFICGAFQLVCRRLGFLNFYLRFFIG